MGNDRRTVRRSSAAAAPGDPATEAGSSAASRERVAESTAFRGGLGAARREDLTAEQKRVLTRGNDQIDALIRHTGPRDPALEDRARATLRRVQDEYGKAIDAEKALEKQKRKIGIVEFRRQRSKIAGEQVGWRRLIDDLQAAARVYVEAAR